MLCRKNNRKEEGLRVVVTGAGVALRKGATLTYDSNVEPRLQAMVDLGIRGGQWVYVSRDLVAGEVTRTSCDLEVDATVEQLQWRGVVDMSDVAPLRIASFDIEASGRRGVFPDANFDRVIMIAIHFDTVGLSEAPRPILLCLRECNPIEGAVVVVYADGQEGHLIRDAARIMGGEGYDCDMLTNWNGHNFDLPYLECRGKLFGVDRAFLGLMSRMKWSPTRIEEAFTMSAQTGRRQCNRVTMPGRLSCDMMVYVQQEGFRLPSFKLDAVAKAFLGDQKVTCSSILGPSLLCLWRI